MPKHRPPGVNRGTLSLRRPTPTDGSIQNGDLHSDPNCSAIAKGLLYARNPVTLWEINETLTPDRRPPLTSDSTLAQQCLRM
jgi:hypothetical protein